MAPHSESQSNVNQQVNANDRSTEGYRAERSSSIDGRSINTEGYVCSPGGYSYSIKVRAVSAGLADHWEFRVFCIFAAFALDDALMLYNGYMEEDFEEEEEEEEEEDEDCTPFAAVQGTAGVVWPEVALVCVFLRLVWDVVWFGGSMEEELDGEEAR
eukprot:EG_transcript_24018